MTEKNHNEAEGIAFLELWHPDGWKMNVLGFREEANHVHKEQLQALVKIMKLMGAEYIESEN